MSRPRPRFKGSEFSTALKFNRDFADDKKPLETGRLFLSRSTPFLDPDG